MVEGSLGLIIEGLVSILLVATIFYCISVNRKLERLRDEQQGMHSFIVELSSATANADKAIQGLRSTVQDTGAELAGQIDKGRNMSRVLKGEIENAEQTMNKLIVLTGSARDSVPAQRAIAEQGHGAELTASATDLRRSMLGFEGVELDGAQSLPLAGDEFLVGARGAVR